MISLQLDLKVIFCVNYKLLWAHIFSIIFAVSKHFFFLTPDFFSWNWSIDQVREKILRN